MARLDEPPAAEPQPARLYDPDTETDPLLRKYVTLPPPGGRDDPRVRGTDGVLYPIWGIVLDYRAVGGDMRRLMQSWGTALRPKHLAAVLRFVELYPDEILPMVEEVERAR